MTENPDCAITVSTISESVIEGRSWTVPPQVARRVAAMLAGEFGLPVSTLLPLTQAEAWGEELISVKE